MAHMSDVAANSTQYAAESLKLVQELMEKRMQEDKQKQQHKENNEQRR